MKESIKGPIIRTLYALLPDKLVVSLFYRIRIGHKLNWKNPTTFTEKMNVAKFDKKYESFHPYCNKLKAKELATSILGDGHVIPTIYHTKKLAPEDFEKFPERFVIKSNHNSQDIDFVWEKSKLTDKEKKRLCKKHNRNLKHNMAKRTHELQYKLIDPEVMIEPIYGIGKGESLTDYKFYCFHGKPEFALLTVGRFQGRKQEAFDKEARPLGFTTAQWNLIAPGGVTTENPIPPNWNELWDAAEKLSKGFDFVRVDLYSVEGNVVFGEWTFIPGDGLARFTKDDVDKRCGMLM